MIGSDVGLVRSGEEAAGSALTNPASLKLVRKGGYYVARVKSMGEFDRR